MSNQYSGGLITKTPTTPNSISAPGVWTLSQQAAAQATNTWPFPRDAQFNYVTMLLQGNGSGGPTSNGSGAGASPTVMPFNSDASTNNFNVTINGDTKSNNFTPYQGDGYYSNSFDGSGDYLTATAPNLTGTWTVELWWFPTNVTSQQTFVSFNSGSFSGINMWCNSSGQMVIDDGVNGQSAFTTVTFKANQWNHVAVVRNGTTTTGYINGAVAGSNSFTPATTNAIHIGRYNSSPFYYVSGYISNLRVVNGTAVYTSAFTPSTTPLSAISGTQLLTCQSNRFIDNSSNVYTITRNGDVAVSPAQPFTLPSSVATYGSGYFSGTTGGYLNAPANTAFNLGTGDFTVGGWVYPTSTATTRPIVEIRTTGGATGFAFLSASGASTLNVYTNGGFAGASTNSLTTNAWNYVALTRSGNTWTYWINGVSSGSFTNSSTQSDGATTGPKIGGSTTSGEIWVGYLTDIFVVKGTAIYTTTFTPPTSPLTAVSGTSLLTTQYNGAGNNSGFKDSSQNNFPITRFGNTSQGTFTPYGSTWSNYFDGSGDYLTAPSNVAFALGTGDYTWEAWIYKTTSARVTLSAISSGSGLAININTSGNIEVCRAGTAIDFTFTAGILNNVWTHVAVTRSGTSLRAFKDGALLGTQTSSTNYAQGIFYVAIDTGGTGDTFAGYMSNLRLIKGTCLYTAAFTPSITPLTAVTGTSLLTCQSNRFIDNSTNNFTITKNGDVNVQRFSPFSPTTAYSTSVIGGSGYFDGSGDYLSVANNSAFNLNGVSFTVECWVYWNSLSGEQNIVEQFTGPSGPGWTLYKFNAGTIDFYGGSSSINSGVTPVAGQWYHLAISRNNSTGTTSFYVNGTRTATATFGVSSSASTALLVGVRNGGSTWFNGYMEDLRVVKGSYVYDPTATTITIPSAPLTAVTSTQLLLNYTNAGILDNAMMNDLETVGNAQISTSVKKYGTGSMYFNGSTDRLQIPITPQIYLGTTYTIEAWVYATNLTGYRPFFSITESFTGGFANLDIMLYGSSQIAAELRTATSGSITAIQTSAISANTWYHVALSVNAGSARLFLNGVQAGSTTTFAEYPIAKTSFAAIGGYGHGWVDNGIPAGGWIGYIDDLRITKGVARYTANFTVPDQTFKLG